MHGESEEAAGDRKTNTEGYPERRSVDLGPCMGETQEHSECGFDSYCVHHAPSVVKGWRGTKSSQYVAQTSGL